jgi:hypothetical protein
MGGKQEEGLGGDSDVSIWPGVEVVWWIDGDVAGAERDAE